jgi:hypothetical protein
MDEQKKLDSQNNKPSLEYADIYACYKSDVHEVSVEVRAGGDRRFVLIFVLGTGVIACGAVALAALGYALYSLLLFILLLLGVLSGAWAVQQCDAKNCKESANKPTDSRTSSIG